MSNRDWSKVTLNEISGMFFASGTRVFGGATPKSDHDFFVHPKDTKVAWDILNSFDTEREEYYDERLYSYKFTLNHYPHIVNLIVFKTEELHDAWVFATDKMENMFENYQNDTMLINRKERHKLFQTFVQIYIMRILDGKDNINDSDSEYSSTS